MGFSGATNLFVALGGGIGPVLIILLAVMVGLVALAVMLPILEAGQGG